MEDKKKKQQLEAGKLDHDTYKHLTTLSTGTIVILASLLEKFFQQPKSKFLIGVTLVSLTISTIASVTAMFAISNELESERESNLAFAGMIILLSCGGFLLGITAFVAFALRNFF